MAPNNAFLVAQALWEHIRNDPVLRISTMLIYRPLTIANVQEEIEAGGMINLTYTETGHESYYTIFMLKNGMVRISIGSKTYFGIEGIVYHISNHFKERIKWIRARR